MSTPSSPSPSASYVPYQAYKSKRHSRNLSNPISHLVPNRSPPPISRPSSRADTPVTLLQPPKWLLDPGDAATHESATQDTGFSTLANAASKDQSMTDSMVSPLTSEPTSSSMIKGTHNIAEPGTQPTILPTNLDRGPSSSQVDSPNVHSQTTGSSVTIFSDARASSSLHSTPRKTSTFRRVPLKNKSRNVQSTGHSRNVSVSSPPPRMPDSVWNQGDSASVTPVVSPGPSEHVPLSVPKMQESVSHSSQQSLSSTPQGPSAHPLALLKSTSTAASSNAELIVPDKHLHSNRPPSRKPAPYRPGFQPKGVYRPLTDEFLALRRLKRDGEGENGMKRVERTKLERRLEKLIALHFPHHEYVEGLKAEKARPGIATLGSENRRASSLFDFQSLRNINEAGDLWRGIIGGGLGDTTKTDIRAAEQRITPWQDDAAVSKCPLCLAPFHPLTNRKHHCRLCGQIMCSLPIKHSQRKTLCSILFVVDKQTRQIEEVGEGVDYGVKKRRVVGATSQQARQEEEDKFLKGVRICRECRPILLRQQYHQQAHIVPSFVKLYESFISLEADIEESLPKFQELLMSLNHNDQPTKEASAARKRLLDSFAQYDKLSKTIRGLPCPNGTGSSQDRVQMAVMTRANLFLQKNMFPLQSLPTPQSNSKVSTLPKPNGTYGVDTTAIPPDLNAALAHTLQPLLEQESLLEAFVEEAQAQRKFEDVKTLKINLAEIRHEIEKILGGTGPERRGN